MAAKRLACACILERYYSFALESTLASTGFEDCLDELSFIKDVVVTEDVVVASLPAADRAWGAQHVSVWRQCADRNAPILIFQDNVLFSSDDVFNTTTALVNAVAPLDHRTQALLLLLDAADPDEEPSRTIVRAPSGGMLTSVRSATQITAYVLWPVAARLLLDALPLDVPVAAFLARHIAERKMLTLTASPALTVVAG